jgi:hypothetical protein
MIKFILLSFFSLSLFAAADDIVSTVEKVKGDVKIKQSNGKISDVGIETQITEGAIIRTGDESFVKLIFIDKSQMTIGGNSLIKISAFSSNNAGIISVLRGQIRALVTKDYMKIEDQNKSKLFIRTKTAAMGIRGTDFQVNYETEKENTTLVTFEGKVAMNKIEAQNSRRELNQKDLESILERKDRIMVSRGEISTLNRESKRAEAPKKIEERAIERLKKKDIPNDQIFDDKQPKKDLDRKTPSMDKDFHEPPRPPLKEEVKDIKNEMRKEDNRLQRKDDRKEDRLPPPPIEREKLPPISTIKK